MPPGARPSDVTFTYLTDELVLTRGLKDPNLAPPVPEMVDQTEIAEHMFARNAKKLTNSEFPRIATIHFPNIGRIGAHARPKTAQMAKSD